jgi:hypothetical protein
MNRKREKVKLKKNAFFRFFQVHKKLATMLVIGVGFVGFFFTINYGRYVKDVIQMFSLRSQNFYFSSDKLTIHGKTYEVNPWSGTDAYPIPISMSSLLNSIKGTTENITYDLTCTGDSKVDCYFDTLGTTTTRRTILTDTHSDNFIVTVIAKEGVTFLNGEKVSVQVKATSVSPYKEELSATFELVIGDYGLNFEIEDEPGNVYFDALVTNTLDVDASKITLKIKNQHINDIIFDMTNPIMQNPTFTYETTVISGDSFITEVSFVLEPKSSLMVKFYKKKKSKDYSYILGDLTIDPVLDYSSVKVN